MESLYWVLTWLCHRKCEHCYEDRFHPYYGEELNAVTNQSKSNFAPIIANLPPRLTYRDAEGLEQPASIILAGGEVLLEPIREPVLYPAIELLRRRYASQGGIKIIVQTTGDLVTPKIIAELRDLGVWMISVSGLDEFHDGISPAALRAKLTAQFEAAGLSLWELIADRTRRASGAGPFYQFFGATPDVWIGKLWPRGRAFQNSLGTATLADNFCAAWSGGKHFLELGRAGAEVSIEPTGDVYPCCLKTKKPVGNLLTESLEQILSRARQSPIYQAINQGRPELMGLSHGWTEEKFLSMSRTTLPDGRPYENLCIGCDRFHEEVLLPPSSLVSIT